MPLDHRLNGGGAQESEGAKATSEVRRPPRSRRAERFVGVHAGACAETKCKAIRHGVKSFAGALAPAQWGPWRTQDERGRPKAKAVAQFFAPEIGRDPISGFAKNGDAPM